MPDRISWLAFKLFKNKAPLIMALAISFLFCGILIIWSIYMDGHIRVTFPLEYPNYISYWHDYYMNPILHGILMPIIVYNILRLYLKIPLSIKGLEVAGTLKWFNKKHEEPKPYAQLLEKIINPKLIEICLGIISIVVAVVYTNQILNDKWLAWGEVAKGCPNYLWFYFIFWFTVFLFFLLSFIFQMIRLFGILRQISIKEAVENKNISSLIQLNILHPDKHCGVHELQMLCASVSRILLLVGVYVAIYVFLSSHYVGGTKIFKEFSFSAIILFYCGLSLILLIQFIRLQRRLNINAVIEKEMLLKQFSKILRKSPINNHAYQLQTRSDVLSNVIHIASLEKLYSRIVESSPQLFRIKDQFKIGWFVLSPAISQALKMLYQYVLPFFAKYSQNQL
ncbi:MAG: hypothetical protein DRH56_04190 [Deltaproteobacteria bacterium]|nr:MAG: hypothetical protein DRH56_04190 [Deltaproteobacteria bacterium]